MYEILEDYKTIYENIPIGKIQRKQQYQDTVAWQNKSYIKYPSLDEILIFYKENIHIKFVKQFFDILIFPYIYKGENKYNIDALLFLFQNDKIREYEQYLSWEVSILTLENMVLQQYPNNITVLEYRYNHLKWWFDYSVHEVPYFVLCGNDVPSLEQIRGMNKDLIKFNNLSLHLGYNDNEWIKYLSSIYNAFENYLLNAVLYSDFKEYLDTNFIEY